MTNISHLILRYKQELARRAVTASSLVKKPNVKHVMAFWVIETNPWNWEFLLKKVPNSVRDIQQCRRVSIKRDLTRPKEEAKGTMQKMRIKVSLCLIPLIPLYLHCYFKQVTSKETKLQMPS